LPVVAPDAVGETCRWDLPTVSMREPQLKETEMLKGLGGLADMGKMMKAAQEMQTKMEELQAELDRMTVIGESGAGLVKATATAKGELTALDIDPSIFNPDEKEVVEDLILAAIKDAQSKAQQKHGDEMQKLTEGLGLPAGMKLPF
jgi:DNA-binding YbaB/EbfC family protein